MENEINTWLEDVNKAIEEIVSFLPEKKEFSAFQKDLKGRRAIERNIEIIGEAINRIIKVNPDFPITYARKIVDTRNRISHGYDTVSDEIVWTIIVKDLGKLQQEVKTLLKE